MRKLVLLFCCWSKQDKVESIRDMLGDGARKVSSTTMTDWFICSLEMLSIDMKVKGEGHIVEIDETSVKRKSKNGVGHVYPDRWLFAGVDRTTKKWFGIRVYDDRAKATLSTIIKKHIKPVYAFSY